MNNINNKLNNTAFIQQEVDKQINRLLAEATILLYEIKAITEKGTQA